MINDRKRGNWTARDESLAEENINNDSFEEEPHNFDRFTTLYIQAMQSKESRDKITGLNLD